MNLLTTALAQTSQPPSGGQSNAAAFFLPAMMLALIVFMFLSARTQKKREKRERDNMHARLAKNDRVQTIGGIIGTVHSIRDDKVVVKVDESTNTKMTFLKTAIQRIVTDEHELSHSKS